MKHFITVFILLLTLSAQAQVDLDYYLPDSVSYNSAIPTPEEILGHQVGEWHVTHDKLVYYMKAVAAASDRISIQTTGTTYEDRPQLLLTITSPENHENIETIKENHKKLTQPSQSSGLNVDEMPAVVYMGFSIHGNESSGSNASLLTAYYLAAAEGIDDKLKNVVVLLDPSFNPDGLNRFATWANMHKSEHLVTDPNDREFNEVWPGGRTNHYWFDMNRDWLPAQLKESQNRIAKFHEWKPNILTDHHEMGTNSTFFFQPGIPERTHPLTPQRNQDLTGEIATYHANYLDRLGSLYYSEESFDDFYYGKGSTFPDVQGSIGILFEQASSRGHAQESVNGVVRFPFTIKNQFTTSLSTFQAAYEMRTKLLNFQRDFYKNSAKKAANDPVKAYIVSDQDKSKLMQFAEMLSRHEIELYRPAKSVNGYDPNQSLVIPTDQYQYQLIKAAFDVRTSFTDSLFYDVSAFNLAMAFNLTYEELDRRSFSESLLGESYSAMKAEEAEIIDGKSDYAYMMRWDDYYAPKVLYRLQEKDIKTRVINKGVETSSGEAFKAGSILIPVTYQNVSADELYKHIKEAIADTRIKVYNLKTGYTGGINLGSRSIDHLRKPKVAMLIGSGISPYDAGEIWFMMDQHYEMPVTKIDINDFNRADLNRYNTIIMPNAYSLNGINKNKVENWLKEGGLIIAYKNAAKWLADNGLSKVEFEKVENEGKEFLPYKDLGNNRGAQVIGGAIFEIEVDLTNPLLYGYDEKTIPIFRNSTLFMKKSDNNYANPARYTESPLLSGYISEENLEVLKSSPAISINRYGSGKIISFTDNTNFRAFWYGTNRLLLNAIFFGETISSGAAR